MNKSKLLSLFTLVVVMISCFSSCKENKTDDNTISEKIMVISDPHFFDADQLVVQPSNAFDSMCSTNDVMLLHSKEILDEQFRRIGEQNPSILLISGDMANNGERVNHEIFHSRYLEPLINKGVKIFVVPGNHDINNPYSFKYNGEVLTPEPSVTPEEFAQIYADCGFNNAVSKDESTLSYSAVLNDQFALIALDVCHYEPGIESMEWLRGSVSEQTMSWMHQQVAAFKADGKEVFVMMHHVATESFANEDTFLKGFVIDDYEQVCSSLVDMGIKFVFNGHFHSQDITEHGDTKLYDISTGASAACACPMRVLNFPGNEIMEITTLTLDDWDKTYNGMPFREYSDSFVYTYMDYYVPSFFEAAGVSDTVLIALVSKIAGDAYITNYCGDEVLSPETEAEIEALMNEYRILRPIVKPLVLDGMYVDKKPQDLNIRFNYITGEIL